MSERPTRRGFAARPANPEHWIKAADVPPSAGERTPFTARLTIDVTPDLRELLAREFPTTPGDPS